MVGNGNVATDVARMLALTREELEGTDTAAHAIDPLAECGVREIVILGRRGPVQAAFTNPELRELGEMEDADVDVDPAELDLDPDSHAHLESDDADITTRRNVEILTEFAHREPAGKPKRIALRFLRSPVEIQGHGRVERLVVARNELTVTTPVRSGPATPASARRSSAGSSCARSDMRESAWTESPSTRRAG